MLPRIPLVAVAVAEADTWAPLFFSFKTNAAGAVAEREARRGKGGLMPFTVVAVAVVDIREPREIVEAGDAEVSEENVDAAPNGGGETEGITPADAEG